MVGRGRGRGRVRGRGRGRGKVFRGQPTPAIGAQGQDELTLSPQCHHIPQEYHSSLPNTEMPVLMEQLVCESQPPSPRSDTPCRSTSSEGSCAIKKNKGRGKYKCIRVDMKTNGGTSRLSVNIPPDIVRAVGENARDLVNFCGFVVRTTAPLNVKNWKEAFADAGDRMWRQVQDRFEFKEDMIKLEEFAVQTMQRVYRGWKSRLHDHYKLFETDEERLANPPEDIPMDQWRFCVNRFGSAEFKAMSERNSRNKRKQMTRHTTGPISFAEKEENMRDPITKQLPPADEVWLAEHTRKTKEGKVQWADPRSKEVHEELKALVTQNSQDESNPMTQDEMLLHVFGARSGYFRGRGTAKKAYTKANQKALVMQQKQQQQQQQRITELEKELQDVNDKIEAERSQREADKNDLREEIRREIRDEIRQEVRDELRQMFGMLFSGNSLFQPQPTNKGA